MAKVKPVVLNKIGKEGLTNIKIRLTHGKKSREISTPYYIPYDAMDSNGRIKDSYPTHAKLNKSLYYLLIEYNSIIDDIGPKIKDMSMSALLSRLRGKDDAVDVMKYTHKRILTLQGEGRYSYADSYAVTLIHLTRFKESVSFKDITPQFLQDFDSYLSKQGQKLNTRRIYLNNIRAIFNYAIDHDVINLPSPFRKFKVKQERTKKTALTLEELRKLRNGVYAKAQKRSVDLFFLSLYLIGVNLKDLLYFTPERIQNSYLSYRRSKLGLKQTFDLRIKIVQEAEKLLKIYEGKRYLLRFLDEDDSYENYKRILKETNKRLTVANGQKLTIGMARQTWATLALKFGVSKSDVDFALAHNLTQIVDGYINYDQLYERVDKANEVVLRNLL